VTLSIDRTIRYPDSDGQPMADNTRQFSWIVLFKENLDCLLADQPEVFVAGDLLWYPVEGHPEIRVAPDAMVVFGRSKGDRGSYRQWTEANIAPQVVFEILSPGNTYREMAKKQLFYDRYGVEEYYVYDPDNNDLTGFVRQDGSLTPLDEMADWVSPRLGIRFGSTVDQELVVYYPDGRRFLTTLELAALVELERSRATTEAQRADQEAQRANQETQRADQETQRADQEAQRADQERDRADRLAARLRELGIEP
jgi:Uma2 family endonuclease